MGGNSSNKRKQRDVCLFKEFGWNTDTESETHPDQRISAEQRIECRLALEEDGGGKADQK